jgi:hypothetical protein
MRRLGYTRYVAQGGDIGAPISGAMARQRAAGLLGIHTNLPATVPSDVAKVLAARWPAPEGLSEKERAAFDSLDRFNKVKSAYVAIMGTRPQTIGYPLTDSPAGLAAWMIDHDEISYAAISQAFNGHSVGDLTRDTILDNITLYWLTNTATSAARLYWENKGRSPLVAAVQKTDEISLPVATTVFPGEIYRAPETWARRAYPGTRLVRVISAGLRGAADGGDGASEVGAGIGSPLRLRTRLICSDLSFRRENCGGRRG